MREKRIMTAQALNCEEASTIMKPILLVIFQISKIYSFVSKMHSKLIISRCTIGTVFVLYNIFFLYSMDVIMSNGTSDS